VDRGDHASPWPATKGAANDREARRGHHLLHITCPITSPLVNCQDIHRSPPWPECTPWISPVASAHVLSTTIEHLPPAPACDAPATSTSGDRQQQAIPVAKRTPLVSVLHIQKHRNGNSASSRDTVAHFVTLTMIKTTTPVTEAR
jgi:hypothetical protein